MREGKRAGARPVKMPVKMQGEFGSLHPALQQFLEKR
jgi:hypothetical protein